MFCLDITVEVEDVKELVYLTFSSEEYAKLDNYKNNFYRLKKNARILKEDKIPTCKEIRYNFNQDIEFTFSDFNSQDTFELLHLLRPFVLIREPVPFKSIIKLIEEKSKNTLLCKLLQSYNHKFDKGEYLGYELTIFPNLKINNELDLQEFFLSHPIAKSPEKISLFCDETLDKWLYGEEYHHDPLKKEYIAKIRKILPDDLATKIFVCNLSGKIRAIYKLFYLIDLVKPIG